MFDACLGIVSEPWVLYQGFFFCISVTIGEEEKDHRFSPSDIVACSCMEDFIIKELRYSSTEKWLLIAPIRDLCVCVREREEQSSIAYTGSKKNEREEHTKRRLIAFPSLVAV